MKKNFLFTLPLLLATILVGAQEVTTYRGAFAPAPEPQWTDTWANWDPKNANYGTLTYNGSGAVLAGPNVIIVTGNIAGPVTTWTSNNVYILSGLVYVNSGVTLKIEPGTIIRGESTIGNSTLLVARGGKLEAIGAPCNPIVFTSSKPVGQRDKGQWGGVIILGNAVNNLGTQFIEGLSTADPRHQSGGTDDDDNSGTLKYVRIEFGGFDFASNNEINGLTMGSVGRGTTIDHVQVSFNNDDGFEWFGGNVNAKHLVSYRNLDDDFDTDNGFSGTIQYALGIKDPSISDNPAISTSEGFESDNDAVGTASLNPKTSAKFYNVTQIGAFRCDNNGGTAQTPTANGFRRGMRIRRLSQLKIYNSILMNNRFGLLVDASTLAAAGQAFQNNVIAGDFTAVYAAPYAGQMTVNGEDAGTTAFMSNAAFSNNLTVNTCALLVNPWTFINPDFRPNVAGAGVVLTNGTNLLTSGADLSTFVDIDNTTFLASQAYDFVANVVNGGGGTTAGSMEIVIAKPSGWNITVPSITLSGSNQSGVSGSSNVFGGTLNNNGDWLFREDAGNVYATSKPGVIIASGSQVALGFTATRKATTSTGTSQNLGVTISTGSGGDKTDVNNSAVLGFTTN